jgi:hypothetical protein
LLLLSPKSDFSTLTKVLEKYINIYKFEYE